MKTIMSSRKIALVLYCTGLLLCLTVESVRTSGVGERLLRTENRELATDGDEIANKVFEDSTNTIGPIKSRLVDLFEKVHIEVVAPNRDLSKMMTVMSTKTRSMFLKEHKKYSEELKIHTTTRPMLLSYLGMLLASDQQVSDWYGRHKVRSHEGVIAGCETFIKIRREAERLNDDDLQTLEEVNKMSNRLPFVHVKFETNLNLFMIDNYLMLCSKLEPHRLREEINSLQVPI